MTKSASYIRTFEHVVIKTYLHIASLYSNEKETFYSKTQPNITNNDKKETLKSENTDPGSPIIDFNVALFSRLRNGKTNNTKPTRQPMRCLRLLPIQFVEI